ncbi:hypothetical protein AB3S75_032965 [Citrus x aurantiifolia]
MLLLKHTLLRSA